MTESRIHLRGFASMSKERQRELASKGGKASSSNFKYSRERASEAGKKGSRAQPIAAKRLGGQRGRKKVL